jgi:hypothetical protein
MTCALLSASTMSIARPCPYPPVVKLPRRGESPGAGLVAGRETSATVIPEREGGIARRLIFGRHCVLILSACFSPANEAIG